MKFTKPLEVILRKFCGKNPYFVTKYADTFDSFPLKANEKEKIREPKCLTLEAKKL